MAKRRQHTIPQFYLRQFLSPGWVYRQGKFAPRYTSNAAGVAVHQDYYGRDKVGKKTLDDLNSVAEAEGAPALRKLVNNPHTITQKDWVKLSYLFANFAVRTPATIEDMRFTMLEITTQINAMAEKMTKSIKKALSEGRDLSEFVQSGLVVPSGLSNESHSTNLEQLNEYANKLRQEKGHLFAARDTFSTLVSIAKCIQRMSFFVLEAPPHPFFVTSDRPLSLQSRKTGSRVGAGWGNSDALGIIALCPSHFLIMCYYPHSIIYSDKLSLEQVAGLNLEIIKFADREVYSPFEYPEADDWMKGLGRWSPQE